MRRFVFGFLACILLAMPGISRAQETLKIAAVVNDQIISHYDLNMRLKLVILFSGLQNTPKTRKRLVTRVLRTMIDEELKRQEAKRLDLIITDKELENVIRNLEESNKLPKGGLKDKLAKQNVEISVLNNQLRADISWKELVNARYGRSVTISDEEVEEVLAEIRKNEGKPEYLVSEIFLPVNKPENEGQVTAIANRLIEQIRSGANFATLAKNFSKSLSAERGGDLGWNRAGQLAQELDHALAQLRPGQLSQPIRTLDGYYILALKDQRTARKFGQPDPDSATVNLQQLFIPVPKGANPTVINDAVNKARETGQNARNCKDLEQAAGKFGSPLSGNLGDIKIGALGIQQRNLIRELSPLKASIPLRMPDGVMVLMVCRRDEVKTPELSMDAQRDRIATNLRDERLSIFGQQYLRELRRNAFLDIRL